MGKITSGATDSAQKAVSGSFSGVGVSGPAFNLQKNDGIALPPNFAGVFNAALWGAFSGGVETPFVGTVNLERSFDGGVAYQIVSTDSVGTPATYTGDVNACVTETEQGVLYRWNCTAYSSGTINYRISQ